ncbi:MAG: PD40 domain-containing protein [Deltaproteobacteria bacterium]|nr:PD40 domain-containing protein [Deltaproteobacteria bacterium]
MYLSKRLKAKGFRFVIFLFNLFFFSLQHDISHTANLDTSFQFSTIETEHFSIHFHQGLEGAAHKAAAIAEEAYYTLATGFNWEPMEKTQMVLIDNSDFTNGWAKVLPYNTIYIQVVPPLVDMTIGEYEDWLKILIIHEYSYILTTDPAMGYSKIMRRIFGKPLPGGDPFSFLMFIAAGPPNVFLPRWWHEGIATWSETEHTKVGRGKSTYYEMIIRMAVADDNIPTVDKINGEVPYWPDGHMPYIFGLRLQKYIADKYGREALGKLNLKHAGRFPYFLNGAPQNLFEGESYISLYREMVKDLKTEEREQIEILKQVPFTPFKILNINGEMLTNPRYSPDGSMIAFNMRDPHGHEAIMIMNKDGTDVAGSVRRLYSDHIIAWSPDSESIYFSQAEVNRGFNIYQDLYSYDIKKAKLKRLTQGLRIKEPDISPDGKKIAVILSDRGNQNLALLTFERYKPKLEIILPSPRFEKDRLLGLRVSGPRWSPDGNFIAYSVTTNNGKSSLYIYDTIEKTHKQLFEDAGNNAYLTWSRDSKYIIYMSDKTRVYNLFAYSMEQDRQYQITHILGGAFQPDVSTDGKEIIFSSYNSRGFKIAKIEYNPEKWMTIPSPTIKPYWNEESSELRVESSELKPKIQNPQSEIKSDSNPYSALNSLLPRFWLPTLSSDHDGAVIGALTFGQDVLGYNTYYLKLDYGVESSEIYYDAVYMNDYIYPTLRLRTYTTPVLYSDFLERGDYYELNRSIIFSMSLPINYLESHYRFILGYHLQKQEALSGLTNNKFNEVDVFHGRRDNVFAGIEFSNSLKYPYSISHEEGRNISFLYRYYSKYIGSDINSREYIASYSEYFLLPFSGSMRHNVIYLNLKGAASDGDRINQQAFQLGGYSSQSEFPLRGYPSRFAAGQYVATGTLEYRAPLWYIFHGINTKPFFWDRLHGAVFTDAGEVWDDTRDFSSSRLKVGAGIEVRLDMTIGYLLEITPTLGIAHGFNQNGETQVYFTIYTNL